MSLDPSVRKAAMAILRVFRDHDASEGTFLHFSEFGSALRVAAGHVKHENQREALFYLRDNGYVDVGEAGLTLTARGAESLARLR